MNLEEAILAVLDCCDEPIPSSRLLHWALCQEPSLWVSFDAFLDCVTSLVERGIICVSDDGLYRLKSEAEQNLAAMGL